MHAASILTLVTSTFGSLGLGAFLYLTAVKKRKPLQTVAGWGFVIGILLAPGPVGAGVIHGLTASIGPSYQGYSLGFSLVVAAAAAYCGYKRGHSYTGWWFIITIVAGVTLAPGPIGAFVNGFVNGAVNWFHG
ncbi:hypothetical protein BIV57_11870 [Mangrovactinospora gilvigrisea]|uniref:Uncharacterized protein n=1 Tax=Mangrovactinospora gilvigrisea TaxID=1428644 RepID=A0A1J7CC68_9ACTN|nr:hypothetical protein [Mangrovactinospora gilvigrisea]OIV37274.1 hypothetical protein BIV57_11870 [Mangrovactinospora gilvigrisea]